MKHQVEVQPDVIPDPEDPPVAKRRGRPRQCHDTRTYNREYYHKKCKKELTCPWCKNTVWSASSLRKHIRTNLKCELVRTRAWAQLGSTGLYAVRRFFGDRTTFRGDVTFTFTS